MKDSEYNEAYQYLTNKFNSSSIEARTAGGLIDNIHRVATYETAIKEVEKTLRNLKALQREQKKRVVERYQLLKSIEE